MKNENKKIMLDRSQGTQLESRENGVTLHTVKEVGLRTGLTRKQLFDYQDMVPADVIDKSGYKLYSEKSISQLQTIAELRKIEMPLITIKKILTGEYEREKAIITQIDVLEAKKKAIEKMIADARSMIV